MAVFIGIARAGEPVAGMTTGGMRETVHLYMTHPADGSRSYSNPVYDEAGGQAGMHNYTLGAGGEVLDESFQRMVNGRLTGEGIYIDYRSDGFRDGMKTVVEKGGRSAVYWWDAAAKAYTEKDPTAGKYGRLQYRGETAREQRAFDLQSGVIDLRSVYGARKLAY
ncbi:MAG TPA: hypothetical protein P5287_06100 [bacterium]|nr:hypothetical protein [bacterium]